MPFFEEVPHIDDELLQRHLSKLDKDQLVRLVARTYRYLEDSVAQEDEQKERSTGNNPQADIPDEGHADAYASAIDRLHKSILLIAMDILLMAVAASEEESRLQHEGD